MKVLEKVRHAKSAGARMIRRIPAAVLVVSSVMLLVSIVCIICLVSSRPERSCAEVWSQGGSVAYRHMAVYGRGGRASGDKSPASVQEYGKCLGKSDVFNVRKSLQGIVDQAGGKRRKASDNVTDPEGWEDAYCSFAVADIVYDHGDSENSAEVSVYAVGGNLKAFHPMEYLSGGFLPVKAVDKYQIVLNDELAWKFFGSYDVVGSRVNLWGHDYAVIGVVKEHDDTQFRAYIYYDCLEEYCAGLEVPVTPAVLCYEVMLPEIVKGEAVTELKNSLPSQDFYVESITGRFGFGRVWDHMIPPGEMSAMLRGYELPYWEVSAQRCISRLFAWEVIGVISLTAMIFVAVSLALNRKNKRD